MKIKVVSLRNHCGLQFIVVQLELFMFVYLNIIELFLFLNYLYFTVELKICQSTMYMTSQINMISTRSSNNNMDSKSTEKYRQPRRRVPIRGSWHPQYPVHRLSIVQVSVI